MKQTENSSTNNKENLFMAVQLSRDGWLFKAKLMHVGREEHCLGSRDFVHFYGDLVGQIVALV